MKKCSYCNENKAEEGQILCKLCQEEIKKNYPKTKFHAHLLEQYKLYTNTIYKMYELKDRYNRFYFSILSGLLGFIIYRLVKNSNFHFPLIIVILLGIGICIIWSKHILQFRKVNKVKYEILKQLEIDLPFPLFYIEYQKLKENRYFKILENYIPGIMLALFLLLFLYVIYIFYYNIVEGTIMATWVKVIIFLELIIFSVLGFLSAGVILYIGWFKKEIDEHTEKKNSILFNLIFIAIANFFIWLLIVYFLKINLI